MPAPRLRPLRLLVLGLLAGCHPTHTLPSPESADARSAVLGIATPDRVEVRGVDLTEGGRGWPALAVPADPELYVELFACPIGRLGLPEGRIPLDPITSGAGLPAPLRAAHRAGLDATWSAAAAPSPAMQDAFQRLPLTEQTACETRRALLERVQTALPADGHNLPAFATPLHDGTALVASREGFYYRVHPNGVVEALPRLVDGDPRAAFAKEDGTLYLLDREGRLHVGRVDGGFEVRSEAPGLAVEDGTAKLVGDTRAAGAPELFLTTTQARFAVFDGRGWTITATAPRQEFSLPHAVWRGPGRVAAVGFGAAGQDLLLYEAGDTRAVPLPGGSSAAGVTDVEGALYLGTGRGDVLRFADGGFEPVGVSDFEFFAHLLAPLPRAGLLVGGVMSFRGFRFGFAQFSDTLGPCAAQPLTPPAVEMAPIDEHSWVVLTVTSLTPRQAFDIAILRQAAPPAACSGP